MHFCFFAQLRRGFFGNRNVGILTDDNGDVSIYPIEVNALQIGRGNGTLSRLVDTIVVAVIGPSEVPLTFTDKSVKDS